jgi:TRAP-type C4-dicarboxylate transport system permease small subunit
MNASNLAAVVLIAAGTLALAYGGFSYTKEKQSADIGSLHLEMNQRERVNIPKWAGIGAIIGGVLLLVVRRKT